MSTDVVRSLGTLGCLIVSACSSIDAFMCNWVTDACLPFVTCCSHLPIHCPLFFLELPTNQLIHPLPPSLLPLLPPSLLPLLPLLPSSLPSPSSFRFPPWCVAPLAVGRPGPCANASGSFSSTLPVPRSSSPHSPTVRLTSTWRTSTRNSTVSQLQSMYQLLVNL